MKVMGIYNWSLRFEPCYQCSVWQVIPTAGFHSKQLPARNSALYCKTL